jgi:hypothetical protein
MAGNQPDNVNPPVTPPVTPPETPPEGDQTLLGGKPKEGGEQTPQAPEKYEINLGEGKSLDTETLDLFTPIFKELGISNEGAQKLVEAYLPVVEKTETAIRTQIDNEFKNLVEEWRQDSMKELGNDAEKKLALCAKAIDKLGGDEFRSFLNETGVGNHKMFIRVMTKVGEMIGEDPLDDKGNQGGEIGEDARLKRMYPSMQK